MSALFRLIWSICRLEAGPEQMPYSPVLLTILMICEFILAWYQFSLQLGMEVAIVHAIILVGIFMVFIYLTLLMGKKPKRFIQTATSLLAVNVLINLLHMPVLILGDLLIYQGQNPLIIFLFTPTALIYIIALNIWLIMITAHIFARTMDTTFSTGLLITIAMLGVNVIGFVFLTN